MLFIDLNEDHFNTKFIANFCEVPKSKGNEKLLSKKCQKFQHFTNILLFITLQHLNLKCNSNRVILYNFFESKSLKLLYIRVLTNKYNLSTKVVLSSVNIFKLRICYPQSLDYKGD
jgi:hypothetical protein